MWNKYELLLLNQNKLIVSWSKWIGHGLAEKYVWWSLILYIDSF